MWCVCMCMHKHAKLYRRVWGHRPQEILEIRCSEIASEAISKCRYQGGFGGFSSPRFLDLWDLGSMEYENQMYLCIDALH